ncbi:MFS general substrate transporter [Gymnopus androsaceus JB14]|uniref:MFS general substrate transporter n=1 Tax=Gymnopus androsaceus JB14 TaxID=1447944 RepID=A0A6A4GHE9_9AGAR|nr:MFS general substrate transporter [Gymnopus androsaceus JB14]
MSFPTDPKEKTPSADLENEQSLSPTHSAREGVSAAYEAKSRLINEYLQNEIGFGRYQWQLFVLTGLGWAADDIWLQGVAIILPQIGNELKPVRVEHATMALYAGLIVGAITWGVLADLIGRRLSSNVTLFLAGVFGVAAGGANSFITLAALIACMGFGYLLTLLSVWWAAGQLLASLIAWPLIANFSCASANDCTKTVNMGWRYTFGGITLLMWVLRYIVFDLQESPKYLVAKGRDEDALKVLEHIASVNGKTLTLTLAQLQAASNEKNAAGISMSNWQIIKHSLSSFSLSHVKPLFSTRRLALNTSITIALWGLIGLAYPLFNGFFPLYLTTHVEGGSSSVSTTYRNYVIFSILSIPGSVIACLVVDWSRKSESGFSIGGRKLAMAVFTALTGIFLFLFTTSTTQADASFIIRRAINQQLTWITTKVFPAPHRGTGDAICSSFNRMTGILAPAIKIVTTPMSGNASQATANAPIFVAASLFLVSAILMVFLPIEVSVRFTFND